MADSILNIDDIEYQAWQHGDRFEAKLGVLAEFSSKDDGKPTVMRYIIRDQAGMAEYWDGE